MRILLSNFVFFACLSCRACLDVGPVPLQFGPLHTALSTVQSTIGDSICIPLQLMVSITFAFAAAAAVAIVARATETFAFCSPHLTAVIRFGSPGAQPIGGNAAVFIFFSIFAMPALWFSFSFSLFLFC